MKVLEDMEQKNAPKIGAENEVNLRDDPDQYVKNMQLFGRAAHDGPSSVSHKKELEERSDTGSNLQSESAFSDADFQQEKLEQTRGDSKFDLKLLSDLHA